MLISALTISVIAVCTDKRFTHTYQPHHTMPFLDISFDIIRFCLIDIFCIKQELGATLIVLCRMLSCPCYCKININEVNEVITITWDVSVDMAASVLAL